MSQVHARTARLIGQDGLEKLRSARVAVFGLGGVGGAAAWGLSRSGVGFLRLVDCDDVAESNLNRQMVADWETIGMRKTDAAERMIRRYNREVMLEKCDLRANEQTIPALCDGVDLVIDAIDDIPAKVGLAVYCTQHGIDILSSMGTGNKLRPDAFSIKDLSKTSGDPLALLLIGLVSGYYLPAMLGLPGNPDFYAVGLGLLLAATAFLALRLTEKKRKTSGKYAPKVVHVERLCEKVRQNG